MKKASGSESVIKVEVSKLGEETKTVSLNAGSTVADALTAAGYPDNSSAKVDGQSVDPKDVVEDGDEIFVGAAVKGGVIA